MKHINSKSLSESKVVSQEIQILLKIRRHAFKAVLYAILGLDLAVMFIGAKVSNAIGEILSAYAE